MEVWSGYDHLLSCLIYTTASYLIRVHRVTTYMYNWTWVSFTFSTTKTDSCINIHFTSGAYRKQSAVTGINNGPL